MFFKILEENQYIYYENYLLAPEIISAFHKECQEKKIRRRMKKVPPMLNTQGISKIIEDSSRLLSMIKPIIEQELYPNFVEEKLIILCNNEGYIIYLMSSPKVLELCYGLNIKLGTCFREEVCGTNAIALSMRYKRLIAVKGEQHYCDIFKGWNSIAAPIMTPKGKIIGYFNISMDNREKLGNIIALAQLTVKYIETVYMEKSSSEMLPSKSVSIELLNNFRTLSKREREVFCLMVKGKTVTETAEIIKISYETVKTYRKRLYNKMGINSRNEYFERIQELRFLIEYYAK